MADISEHRRHLAAKAGAKAAREVSPATPTIVSAGRFISMIGATGTITLRTPGVTHDPR